MFRTDDPIADFNRHDAERERRLIRFPVCACCDERIQDDDLYDFDGELVCPECLPDWLTDNYKKRTVNYIVEEV